MALVYGARSNSALISLHSLIPALNQTNDMNESASRRRFLQTTGVAVSVMVAGKMTLLTPSQAYSLNAATRVLNQAQVTTLEALAEALVPGSRNAGITHFIDSQLAGSAEDSLLMLKYLGVPQPHANFYQAALDALATSVKTHFKKNITELNQAEISSLIGQMNQDALDDWAGPPASFFYFVLRSDGVDVVYGVESGFAQIDMPSMEHIKPTQAW